MSRWRAEYDDGIWRFYRDGMELGLYEKGDVVIDALNNAESRIAKLEEKQRWIPVGERLPKNLELVLAVADYEIVGLTRYLAGFGRENVTHWMPLPESPTDQLTADSTDERKDDKWIPVSERLPEKYTPVWVTTTWGEQHSGNLTDDCWTGLFRDFREGEVTHWMPLPESPNDTQTQTIVYGKECEE